MIATKQFQLGSISTGSRTEDLLRAFANTYSKRQARPCLLCSETVHGTFADLEDHAKSVDMRKHEVS